jgi:hypothetical protein
VAAADLLQGRIVNRLDTDLQGDVGVGGEVVQEIEYRGAETVGTGTDRYADHVWLRRERAIQSLQFSHRAVRVGVRLEVYDVIARPVAPGEVAAATFELLAQGEAFAPRTRRKRRVVAERAAGEALRAFEVGAGKARVHAQLAHRPCEPLPEVAAVRVERQSRVCGLGHHASREVAFVAPVSGTG